MYCSQNKGAAQLCDFAKYAKSQGFSCRGSNILLTCLPDLHVHVAIRTMTFAFCLQSQHSMSLTMRKPAFCICENKDADQLRGNREADQHLCFHYMDSTIPLLHIYGISSL